MTRDDDQLQQLFAGVRFADEPPVGGSVDDDIKRARRALRKRRWRLWGAAAAGGAVIVSGVAVAAPNLGSGDGGQAPIAEGAADGEADAPAAAGSPAETNSGPAAADVNACPAEPVAEQPEENPEAVVGFPNTRQCLLEAAVKHLDPDWKHLPEQSTGGQTGGNASGSSVGTKLGWTVPGEDGLGLVQVAVTTPGYADDGNAVYSLPGMMICDSSPDACRSESVPGTDHEVLVVEDDPEHGWSLAVAYERPDGSIVSVAVDRLFGNNSEVPVSHVDITLEQAIAFVTDPAIHVDGAEAAESQENAAREIEAEDADYSSSEVVAAPEIREMTDEEAQVAVEACIESVPEWSDFQPEFGVWMTTRSGDEEFLVIAERGDSKMECRAGGGSLFGTPEVKSSPYLRGPVSYNNFKFGRYVSDVDLVTVQPSGGPAYEAVMKNGYWFLPESLGIWQTQPAIRGYDAIGERVYDSVTEDRDQCYADPDGNEVVFYRSDEVPAVEDCLPALEWDH
jgi:hypothetical protein